MNINVFVLSSLLSLSLLLDARGAQKKLLVESVPDGVAVEYDVSYLPGDRKEKADVYRPKGLPAAARLPAVLIIHGGGFNDGDKGKGREVNFGVNLAMNGYVGLSINYKLRKVQGQVTWPQNLHDCKAAVRWLRQNAEKLNVDPERIGVMGSSAGGNLAAMLALTRPSNGLDPDAPYGGTSAAVRCAVDFYGAVDLINYHDVKMFARSRADDPDLYKKASPISYAYDGAPPLMIVHGTADETVPLSQSEALVAALKAVGAPYEFLVIPDAPHTFHLQRIPDRDLRAEVMGFLDRHLKSTHQK